MATYRKQEGKRGTTWLVRVRRNGKSYTQTFPTKKMAQEWATTMEHGIIEQAHFPERATPEPALSSHTMGELIDDYTTHMLPQLAPKTQKTHGTLLRWWRRQLEDTLVINMKVPLIKKYKNLLAQTRKNPTVNLYLNILSAVLSYAASEEMGWIADNPCLKVPRFAETGRTPTASHLQIKDLLRCSEDFGKPHLALFVKVALGTGGRLSEILRAQWKQLNFETANPTITFVNTKNKKERRVPLPVYVVDALKAHFTREFIGPDQPPRSWDDRHEGYIFRNPKNQNKPLTDIHNSFNKACAKANLPLTPHSLRHIFCTRMAETGADIAVLADLLGPPA